MKLLVADDEQRIRNGLLSLPWESIGIQKVYQAENGIEAIEVLKKEKIDIIISDVKMPGLSGLDLAEHIKQYAMDTAVILLTGFSDFEYVQRALRNEVFDYMLKPLRPKDILNTVERVKERLEQTRYKEMAVRQYEAATGSLNFEEQIGWNFQGINRQAMDILLDMAKNYSQGISLNSLAEKYHFSVGYLSRMLKKETGYSFSALLNSIRLAAAIELLMEGHTKVGLIGDQVGFRDQKYFGQVFKRAFGCSPVEFRRKEDMRHCRIKEILEMTEEAEPKQP